MLISSIFFSPNTRVNIREQLSTTLNIMTEALNDKYLGLPANVGMDKSDCFQYLIEYIIMKVSGWKEKPLFTGGKEILLKFVVQAIPTYVMSIFKIHKKLARESLMRCLIFGGETRTIRSGRIGWLGGKCVYPKIKGAWDSGIFIVSTWQCWQNKLGVFLRIQSPYVLPC